jgi:DNA-binding MarR family transcriptional regulator
MARGLDGPDVSQRPLAVLLARTASLHRHVLGRRMQDEQWAVEAGFRPPCIGALTTIAGDQPLSQRQLSEHLGVDPSDIVGVVDILERAGYVSRQRDPADRRRQALTLTPAGERAVRRLHQVLAEVDEEIFGPVPAGDRAALRRVLEGVVARHA